MIKVTIVIIKTIDTKPAKWNYRKKKFWMIDPMKEHQITMNAELEIKSNIDINTSDLITGTHPSTTCTLET